MSKQYAKTFEDLLYDELNEDTEVYASVHIGENKIPQIAQNENVDRVIMFEEQLPRANLEEHFGQYEDIDIIDPEKTNYENLADAEFVSAPGNQAQLDMGVPEAQKLLYEWAIKSDKLVDEGGKTFFLDYSWEQAVRGGARSDELTMDKVHEYTESALRGYFEDIKKIEGEDFSGILAERY